ncbi:MAG: chorismate synthase [Lachnospiraceae bacterium]|jgi:chorismate synthase|nr:chorismate synthase [Lachnospiraceae bacterium]
MSGSTLGTHFKISTWGESHGTGIGVVIDGCPAGVELCEADIQTYLDRRKPGQTPYTSPRQEADLVHLQAGVFDGKTTGTPISLVIYNTNQKSRDYSEIASYYRPGHADYSFDAKYGFRDYRGGGRSSGRETAGRVAAGAVAAKILSHLNIFILTYTRAIGPVAITATADQLLQAKRSSLIQQIRHHPLQMPDPQAAEKASHYLDQCIRNKDSAGGIIEAIITGLPAGIGEPVFDKLDARLAAAILSIGAVKGFEVGSGFLAAASTGSNNNDSYTISHSGQIQKNSNHAGGILGGISDGSPVIFRAAIKPTPSIATTQTTINTSGEEISVCITGRHDPVIVPRAVVVVEAMTALTVLDLLLANMGAKIDYLEKIYKRP